MHGNRFGSDADRLWRTVMLRRVEKHVLRVADVAQSLARIFL